jgi:hypothetical protein
VKLFRHVFAVSIFRKFAKIKKLAIKNELMKKIQRSQKWIDERCEKCGKINNIHKNISHAFLLKCQVLFCCVVSAKLKWKTRMCDKEKITRGRKKFPPLFTNSYFHNKKWRRTKIMEVHFLHLNYKWTNNNNNNQEKSQSTQNRNK